MINIKMDYNDKSNFMILKQILKTKVFYKM